MKKNKKEKEDFDNRIIDIFSIVTDIAEKESDRMWTRFNTFYLITSSFLGLNILLLSEYFKQEEGKIAMLIICIFICIIGITLSAIWYKIVIFSFEWQNRWIRDQIKIIKSDKKLESFVRGRNTEKLRGEQNTQRQKRTSTIIKSPPIIFLIFFFLSIVFEIWLIFTI